MIEITTTKIIQGDSRIELKNIPSQSVHLIITSPPYGQVVDYGHQDQIGYGQPELDYYIDLFDIWKECVRVLHPGCRMVINIGDEFIPGKRDPDGQYHIVPHQSRMIQYVLANEEMTYTGTIIWKKVNGHARDRSGSILGSIDGPRDGHFFVNREYILVFKKRGKGPTVSKQQKEASRFTKEERAEWFRDTWTIPGRKQDIHPAMFPIEIPERLIRMYSFVGETVLDPFVGSGTTLEAAEKWGRDGIGIDLLPS